MMTQTQLAYNNLSAPVRTTRSAEYDVIARVTRQLVAADAARASDYPRFIEALAMNERLWAALAADVVEAGNGLPGALRARLFYLYRFTAEHSRRVRSGAASATVLVDINTAVMRGLRGEGTGS